ncbi:M15 family metallopeptidase [Butyrivibrio sp. YAB3001]|uniref:M15 family metallopeptidase n=1 Tax=Butyrivibrio sp. YAB3001 TaxID=1520812 RepID=UPI0008F670D6|nr:M15 family metallopeptidase [Butyrivibrio sp. YAB3001]SFB66540.1 D-alanyl-D-alanine carboxypeptidase [Butyrivibrio sp. YAB3001]
MNAGNLQKKITYKEKIISRVEKFNRKHKKLTFLGIAYAVTAIVTYNFLFYFYRNTKRFTALACLILFFVFSSSFSFPSSSLNISFASDISVETTNSVSSDEISNAEVAQSDAEFADQKDVDMKVLEEASESTNPDVSEADHMNPEKQVSLDDILESESIAEVSEDDTKAQDDDLLTKSDDVIFSSDDWKIILVNKQHPFPDNYQFPLGTISGTMRCDERIIQPLLEMMKAAASDNVSLIICSPYRDRNRQTMLFNNKIDRYMEAGMSYMDSYNLASQAVTVPGSSEHQIGLAIDIITDGYSSLDEGFANTAAGKWLSANSYKYGFILRYPAGKEEITSIEYEPWHFRYVGVDAATIMAQNNICLEEFWSIYVE